MDMPIGVVIVNYNVRDALRDCLSSVIADGAVEIHVVDNNSRDESAAMVRTEFPTVVLHENRRNPGYGAAANQAIAVSSSPYILLLNADTYVKPGTLRGLIEYLQSNPMAAIVGPKLIDPDGTLQPSCLPFPGTCRWLVDNDSFAPITNLIPGVRERSLRGWRHDKSRIVPWVTGAALAIRKEAFVSVGGFDESIFLYYEETDLCRRLKDQRWEVHFTPAGCVVHLGALSTSQRRIEMKVQLHRSLLAYYDRHFSKFRRSCLVFVWQLLFALRWLRDRCRLWAGNGSERGTWT
jgi:GT2 family glycosyltransferase